jgi:hypothetical protein
MWRLIAVMVVVIWGAINPVTARAEEPFVLSLEGMKVGQLPPDWTATRTGQGPGSVWKVLKDTPTPGGNVLAQTSDQGPNRLFNLCVADKTSFADLDLTVDFKPVAGKLDQGGGALWRCRDADNYYLARMNPLETNFRVYKVVGGKRSQLATADVKAPAGKWYTLRIVHQGRHIQCYLDGKRYLDVQDDTFPAAGKVGLWTKADAQTYFANLKVVGTRRVP